MRCKKNVNMYDVYNMMYDVYIIMPQWAEAIMVVIVCVCLSVYVCVSFALK